MSESPSVVVYSRDRSLSHPGELVREMFGDLWRGRELAWRLAIRNLSAMYRQTILGFIWAFLPPIVSAATFIALQHGGVLKSNSGAIPFPLWVLTGSFLWQTFADAINGPLRLVSQSKAMLTKINFPREALILAGIWETLFNFAVRLLILIPILGYFHFTGKHAFVLSPSLFAFPLALLLLIGLGTMIGLLLTPAAMLYKDIEKILIMVLPFLMLFSGAVISVPESGIGRLVCDWNPILPVLETCRNLLLGQPVLMLGPVLAIAAATLLLIGVGWVLYRISMPHIIARLGG